MMWGELPQHPDWVKLVRDVEIRVDNARDAVLTASEREDLLTVRSRVGAYNALRTLLRELKGV